MGSNNGSIRVIGVVTGMPRAGKDLFAQQWCDRHDNWRTYELSSILMHQLDAAAGQSFGYLSGASKAVWRRLLQEYGEFVFSAEQGSAWFLSQVLDGVAALKPYSVWVTGIRRMAEFEALREYAQNIHCLFLAVGVRSMLNTPTHSAEWEVGQVMHQCDFCLPALVGGSARREAIQTEWQSITGKELNERFGCTEQVEFPFTGEALDRRPENSRSGKTATYAGGSV